MSDNNNNDEEEQPQQNKDRKKDTSAEHGYVDKPFSEFFTESRETIMEREGLTEEDVQRMEQERSDRNKKRAAAG